MDGWTLCSQALYGLCSGLQIQREGGRGERRDAWDHIPLAQREAYHVQPSVLTVMVFFLKGFIAIGRISKNNTNIIIYQINNILCYLLPWPACSCTPLTSANRSSCREKLGTLLGVAETI